MSIAQQYREWKVRREQARIDREQPETEWTTVDMRHLGTSRREVVATAALSGLLANAGHYVVTDNADQDAKRRIISGALLMADDLIARLDADDRYRRAEELRSIFAGMDQGEAG